MRKKLIYTPIYADPRSNILKLQKWVIPRHVQCRTRHGNSTLDLIPGRCLPMQLTCLIQPHQGYPRHRSTTNSVYNKKPSKNTIIRTHKQSPDDIVDNDSTPSVKIGGFAPNACNQRASLSYVSQPGPGVCEACRARLGGARPASFSPRPWPLAQWLDRRRPAFEVD